MIVREWLQQARERLSGLPSPEADSRILLESLMGRPLDGSAEVDVEKADALLKRREAGEPVQYITGEGPFRYLVLSVGPGVLVPRPETELLVDVALKEIDGKPLKVADLGAGAGTIAISLATESSARVTAVEKDEQAFSWLKKNVEQFAPHVECILSDVRDLDLDGFDLVIANPPYVPDSAPVPSDVVDHEPHIAIFGGEDGTAVPEAFLKAAHRILNSGGLLIMEHSDSHQEKIADLARLYFSDVEKHRDLLDRPRFITARKA